MSAVWRKLVRLDLKFVQVSTWRYHGGGHGHGPWPLTQRYDMAMAINKFRSYFHIFFEMPIFILLGNYHPVLDMFTLYAWPP